MIKSKINTWGFWMTPIIIFLLLGTLIFSFAYLGSTVEDKIVFSIWGFVGLFLTISQLFYTSKSILIDTVDKKIVVNHYLTGQTKIYNFKNIDGYIDIIEKPTRGRPFRVIHLVQNQKYVQKISSFIYSNIAEMEVGLKEITYLGQKEYSYLNNIKILFGRKMLNDDEASR